MAKQVKKFVSTSNGNQVYVTDVASIADFAASFIQSLPWRASTLPVLLNGWTFSMNKINAAAGCYAYLSGKLFYGDYSFTVGRGEFVYAEAQYDTSEPRTSTTGVEYYQSIVYTIRKGGTLAESGIEADLTQPIGKFVLINGAATGLMNDEMFMEHAYTLFNFLNPIHMSRFVTNPITSNTNFVTGSVPGNAIADGGVSTVKLAGGAVTGPKLAEGSVSASNIATGLFPLAFRPSAATISSTGQIIKLSPWAYCFILGNQDFTLIASDNAQEGSLIKCSIRNGYAGMLTVNINNMANMYIQQGKNGMIEIVRYNSRWSASWWTLDGIE